MRRTAIGIAAVVIFGFMSSDAYAVTKLKGTYSAAQIKSACDTAGGEYTAPGSIEGYSGYGCQKKNCDGKGGTCEVACDDKGKCVGKTPTTIRASATATPSLVLKNGGTALQTAPQPKTGLTPVAPATPSGN